MIGEVPEIYRAIYGFRTEPAVTPFPLSPTPPGPSPYHYCLYIDKPVSLAPFAHPEDRGGGKLVKQSPPRRVATICWHCIAHAGPAAYARLNAREHYDWRPVPANEECCFCWLFIRLGE